MLTIQNQPSSMSIQKGTQQKTGKELICQVAEMKIMIQGFKVTLINR